MKPKNLPHIKAMNANKKHQVEALIDIAINVKSAVIKRAKAFMIGSRVNDCYLADKGYAEPSTEIGYGVSELVELGFDLFVVTVLAVF